MSLEKANNREIWGETFGILIMKATQSHILVCVKTYTAKYQREKSRLCCVVIKKTIR